jgi:hypothetical protein
LTFNQVVAGSIPARPTNNQWVTSDFKKPLFNIVESVQYMTDDKLKIVMVDGVRASSIDCFFAQSSHSINQNIAAATGCNRP